MSQVDFDSIREAIDSAQDEVNRFLEAAGSFGSAFANGLRSETGNGTTGQNSQNKTNPYVSPIRDPRTYRNWKPPQLFENISGKRVGAIVQSIIGIFWGVVGIPGFFQSVVEAFSRFDGDAVFGIVLGAIIGFGGLFVGIKGIRKKKMLDRFKTYVKALKKKEYVSLRELEAATDLRHDDLVKELEKMIAQRMFLQGHLDDEETTLIVTDAAYEQYKLMKAAHPEPKMTFDHKDEGIIGMTTEGQEIVRQAEEYLEKIRMANEALPGEVITEKLSRLESVIHRLLLEVREQPDQAFELRKMTNYYLPTTWKLLESYQQIERESLKTEMMVSTQKEIENSIDTINDAFEQLLDKLFRNTAWDISSDISVLNSMLTKEGLKKSDFELNKED